MRWNSVFFEYGQTEIGHLKKKDKKMGLAIDKIGMIKRKVIPDLFTALVASIIGQQISSKAADTVERRFIELVGEVVPEKVDAISIEDIQKCGMSLRKADYIKGVTQAVLSGEVDLALFAKMSDDEIIKKLSSLNGVGVWTAEMILIFSLMRSDVLSWGDLAIRRGMMNLYGLKKLDKEQFEKYRKRYSPYGTVASLYLWELSVQE
jgi:3-methyladenine DNA glycosylase/8-oxoguanine DNA glycosylase